MPVPEADSRRRFRNEAVASQDVPGGRRVEEGQEGPPAVGEGCCRVGDAGAGWVMGPCLDQPRSGGHVGGVDDPQVGLTEVETGDDGSGARLEGVDRQVAEPGPGCIATPRAQTTRTRSRLWRSPGFQPGPSDGMATTMWL